jgi:hypothetical protein
VTSVAKACEPPTGLINRCLCGNGEWPCAETVKAWREAGLDPAGEARRQIGMRIAGSLVARRSA